MDPTNDALVKLASELTDRVEELERENQALKSTAAKTVVKTASEQAIKTTCDALLEAGALSKEQISQTKQAYQTDPDAAHRTIKCLIDALANTKTASEANNTEVFGGSLVYGKIASKTAEDDCLDTMARILGMN